RRAPSATTTCSSPRTSPSTSTPSPSSVPCSARAREKSGTLPCGSSCRASPTDSRNANSLPVEPLSAPSRHRGATRRGPSPLVGPRCSRGGGAPHPQLSPSTTCSWASPPTLSGASTFGSVSDTSWCPSFSTETSTTRECGGGSPTPLSSSIEATRSHTVNQSGAIHRRGAYARVSNNQASVSLAAQGASLSE